MLQQVFNFGIFFHIMEILQALHNRRYINILSQQTVSTENQYSLTLELEIQHLCQKNQNARNLEEIYKSL